MNEMNLEVTNFNSALKDRKYVAQIDLTFVCNKICSTEALFKAKLNIFEAIVQLYYFERLLNTGLRLSK